VFNGGLAVRECQRDMQGVELRHALQPLKATGAPLPQVCFMPTGGVTLDREKRR